MKKCPKCGKTSGFLGTVETVEKYVESWDGQNQELDSLVSRKEWFTVKCIDCGTKFKRSEIEKLRDKS